MLGYYGEFSRYGSITYVAVVNKLLENIGDGGISLKISYLKLWKLLLDKKMKKTDLLDLAGIGSNTLAKLSKDQPVGVEILARICNALSCDIADIIEMVPDDDAEEQNLED